MKATVLSVFLAMAALPASAAGLEPIYWQTVGDWEILARGEKDGCFTGATYGVDGENWLGFSLYQDDPTLYVVVGKGGWEIPPGDYIVDLSVDGAPWQSFDATPSEGGALLFVEVLLDPETIRVLRFGDQLRARAGKQIVTYNLTGTAQMLPALVECVNELKQRGRNPFEGSSAESNPFGKVSR